MQFVSTYSCNWFSTTEVVFSRSYSNVYAQHNRVKLRTCVVNHSEEHVVRSRCGASEKGFKAPQQHCCALDIYECQQSSEAIRLRVAVLVDSPPWPNPNTRLCRHCLPPSCRSPLSHRPQLFSLPTLNLFRSDEHVRTCTRYCTRAHGSN
jgi:hypothetical protein